MVLQGRRMGGGAGPDTGIAGLGGGDGSAAPGQASGEIAEQQCQQWLGSAELEAKPFPVDDQKLGLGQRDRRHGIGPVVLQRELAEDLAGSQLLEPDVALAVKTAEVDPPRSIT